MTALQSQSQKVLRDHINAIEQMEDAKKDVSNDIKDRYALAKSQGFDPKAMKKLIALRKRPKAEREAEEALVAQYAIAMGLEGTPLGRYADTRQLETTVEL